MGFVRYTAQQFGNPTGFGGILATYIMNILNRKQYRAVVNIIKEHNLHEKILDIGFGNGYLIKKLSKVTPAQYYGIEISEDILKKASVKNRKAIKKGNMLLCPGNVEDIPFKAAFFDIIYTVNTIYFWENTDAGFREIYRVLKNGGIFINVVYTKEWLDKLAYTQYGFKKYDREEICKAAIRNKLQVVEVKELKKEVSYALVLMKR